MGYAALHGKAWVVDKLYAFEDRPKHFADVGCGAGSWLDSVKPWFLDSHWIGIEPWTEYWERFELLGRYDLMLPWDVREPTRFWPEVDVTIMGDVLEHMTEDDAVAVWEKAGSLSRKGRVISIPIVDYPQGHVHGNPYQEHVGDPWSHERVMDTFRGIAAHELHPVVGVYATW